MKSCAGCSRALLSSGAPATPAAGVQRADREAGQASAEFALVLPLVLLVFLGLIQAGLVLRDQLLVASAAREGAREASVSADPSRVLESARRAASGLDLRLSVSGRRAVGEPVAVQVRCAVRSVVPLVGKLFEGHTLTATAVMRIEKE